MEEILKNAVYMDAKRSVEERVEDLMARMTPLEKACQLSCAYAYGGTVDLANDLKDGIGQVGMSNGTLTLQGNAELVNSVQKYLVEETRLGIPALFHVESLNGVSMTRATTYPIPTGLASAWDTEAVEKMGRQIHDEMVVSGQRMALAPVLDISRDPRWGRMGETYGECPTLAAAMGSAYIRGIQGDWKEKGVSACAKHFLGYAASEGGMNMSGAHIGPRELHEVYAKPFAAAIQDADLHGIMNCYLAIDGEPVTGTYQYLTELLRGELGFTGVTVADYGSMDKLCDVFGLAKDKADAGRMALAAGLDTEAPRRVCLGDTFVERLESGEIDSRIVDEPLRRLLSMKFALGLFEDPYVDLAEMETVVQKEEHRKLAYDLACESMVLLKNEDGILPLTDQKKIAVIGPDGDDLRALFGGYTYPAFYEAMRNMLTGMSKSMGLQGVNAQEGQMAFLKQMLDALPEVDKLTQTNYPGVKTVYEGIRETVAAMDPEAEVRFEKGCELMGTDRSGFDAAVSLAKDSQITLFICGGRNGSSDGCTMGENVDSSHVGLPGVQEELAKELAATGTKLVLIHMDGKPLSSPWAKEHAAAILEAWHPGQLGAQAIADTLVGKNNPCGKLSVTAIRHEGQIPVYAEQPKGSGVSGRGAGNNNITQGYVDEEGFPLYPLGYGISYTDFSISDICLSQETMTSEGSVEVTCTVTNTCSVAGTDIVQLYFTDQLASVIRPAKELAGFVRVELQPGESKVVRFTFMADQTALFSKEHQWQVEAGAIDLMVGQSSADLMPAGTVQITDTRTLAGGHRHYYSVSGLD
jgi:beta-glucosidase